VQIDDSHLGHEANSLFLVPVAMRQNAGSANAVCATKRNAMFAWIKSTLTSNPLNKTNQVAALVTLKQPDPVVVSQQLDKFELFRQWLEDTFDADEAERLMEAARLAWSFNQFFTKEGHFPHARRCLIEGAYLLPDAGQMTAWIENNPINNSRYPAWADNMQKAYNFPPMVKRA
jgi:hypothetical protein